jgi:IclR family mhp operon transcriptional activator
MRDLPGDEAHARGEELQGRARAGASVDEEAHLAEAAAPILTDLGKRVRWPSVLAVPRLDHMAVIETNRPISYFKYILRAPLGFRINMLRSASGRTYLAYCSPDECAAIVARLANSSRPGDALARNPARLDQILAETRKRGYGTRDPDFGGNYDQPRSRVNDGRNSIAVPILVQDDIAGCINLTWIAKVATVKSIADRFLPDLRDAARSIGDRMSA